jgi:hypothetical protein
MQSRARAAGERLAAAHAHSRDNKYSKQRNAEREEEVSAHPRSEPEAHEAGKQERTTCGPAGRHRR